MNGAKLSIRTGIAEIESELPSLDLDGHSVGRRRRQIYVGPCLHPENSESEDLRAHEQHGADDQSSCAPGKTLNFFSRARVRKSPYEQSQHQLCGEEGDSSFHHGL